MSTYTVALVGNPNVGKSTVFNGLTGLHQHTGNWPGKTVAQAVGTYTHGEHTFRLVDLPGTYSLRAESPEEEVTRDFIASGEADVVLVVVDATCLRRNLHLALQVRQIAPRMVLCVNLLDEAKKKGIVPNLAALSEELDVLVVGTAARQGDGMEHLQEAVLCAAQRERTRQWNITYPPMVESLLPENDRGAAALNLLQGNDAVAEAITTTQMQQADAIGRRCAQCHAAKAHHRDRRWDHLATSRRTGILIMLLLVGLVFFITIWGANAPSELLSRWLMGLQEPLRGLLAGTPWWVQGAVVDGIYRTVAWVVAVMLPPMAILFPLFTLLEDIGYLPRLAFNLDRFFRAAGAHGRQSLTMCMGFGCNACGVTGCRIIDSPRERLVAMLTNCFVPCNGRFPTLIALITLFFLGGSMGLGRSLLATVIFLCVILFAVAMTWVSSKLLSSTVLRGEPSSFTLELPPYRLPQWGQVLVRSLLDRTLFVLGRSLTVAAPAGLLIWTLGNVTWHELPLLSILAGWLDPLGQLMGLDGMILLAFLLGLPANEIVLPILLMGYLHTGSLTEYSGLSQLHEILVCNGWTTTTALCMMAFCLMHFPCGTTCLTIRKESGSWKWTAVGIALPTVMGVAGCMLIHLISTCL